MLTRITDARLRERLRLHDPDVQSQVVGFAERHHLQSIAIFGSILRDDFRTSGDDPSDVDVLVEFDPGYIPDWDYYLWGEELQRVWGYKTEVCTTRELSDSIRRRVLQEAVTLYERERSIAGS